MRMAGVDRGENRLPSTRIYNKTGRGRSENLNAPHARTGSDEGRPLEDIAAMFGRHVVIDPGVAELLALVAVDPTHDFPVDAGKSLVDGVRMSAIRFTQPVE